MPTCRPLSPNILVQESLLIVQFFIQKRSSPSAQKATWSDNKHHNTVNLLVGINPSGALLLFPNSGLEVQVIGVLLKRVGCLTFWKRETMSWQTGVLPPLFVLSRLL